MSVLSIHCFREIHGFHTKEEPQSFKMLLTVEGVTLHPHL